MKELELTNGQFAIVDDEDFDELNQWKWTFSKGYAIRCDKFGNSIYMHRAVNKTPTGMQTDHINQNKLDNRKENLRASTRSQNMANVTTCSHNTSGYKGVSFHKNRGKWRAYIRVNKKQISLGMFTSKEIAAIAYNEAAKVYFGNFAKLNSVGELL